MSLYVSLKKDFGGFCLNAGFETEGGVLGFLGASGCGKSMALRCIAGIETPDEGRIIVNGTTLFDSEKGINLPPQKRRVGYLFQNYALFPHMTVEQNILCGLCRRTGKEEKRRLAGEMIEKMMLTEVRKRRPSQLSGGQQQRAALARILVNEPDVLLLDEPFSALDSYLKERLQTEMKRILREFGKDTILVTHSRDEAYRLCTSLAVMSEGRILGMGGVKEMFKSPASREGAVLTGCKNLANAVKSGDHEVYVPDWDMYFTSHEPVKEGLVAIGIRAHYFNSRTTVNAGRVVLEEEIEEPFEWILKFRYVGAGEDSEPVWWRMAKETKPAVFPLKLGIAPQNIMLLYE